jgi:hypothetical protein
VIAEWFADVKGLVSILAWPAVVVFALLLFRRPLAELIRRVKQGSVKVGGVQVQVLVEESIATLPQVPELTETTLPVAAIDARTEHQILEAAEKRPRDGLTRVSNELDRATRRLAMLSFGDLNMNTMTDDLVQRVYLIGDNYNFGLRQLDVLRATFLFEHIRKAIEREGEAFSDEDVRRTVDLGLRLLGVFVNTPNERFVIGRVGLETFTEAGERLPYQGVEIITYNLRTGTVIVRGWATERRDYKPDMEVGWGFAKQQDVPGGYAFDPATGERVGDGWGTPGPLFNGVPLDD